MPYGREDNTCLVKTCTDLVSTIKTTQAVKDIISPSSEYCPCGLGLFISLLVLCGACGLYCGSMALFSILVSHKSFHFICKIIGWDCYLHDTN